MAAAGTHVDSTEQCFPEFQMQDMDVTRELELLSMETGVQIPSLKPKQLEVLQKARNTDCFVSLKTGYGKTLIFQLLPYIMHSIVIVVSPLDVIIEQCLELSVLMPIF